MPPRNPSIPEPYAGRIARVRGAMGGRRLDAYLVFDRMDQIWLTGFTGENGGVLVTRRQVVLLTDGRFAETADLEAPFARKVLRKKRGPEATARELKRCRAARVGFDPSHMDVKTFGELRKLARPAKLEPVSGLITAMRQIKDAGEIAAIRRAIRVAENAFARVQKWLKPGRTEREVAARLVYEMQRLGAQGASFEPIVAYGATSSLPHYEPSDRVIAADAGVLVDWGARVDWYVSDLTRMLWPGSIPRRFATVYRIVKEAQERAIAVIAPGIKAGAVDRVAREHIRKSGYGKQFTHSLGHGFGLDVHERPGLRKKSDERLEPGMVVTVEPGIYLPGVGGIRIEDDVLVTETGHEVLSSLSKDLP